MSINKELKEHYIAFILAILIWAAFFIVAYFAASECSNKKCMIEKAAINKQIKTCHKS